MWIGDGILWECIVAYTNIVFYFFSDVLWQYSLKSQQQVHQQYKTAQREL